MQERKLLAYFGGGLVTLGEIFFESAANDAFKSGRHLRIDFTGRTRIAIEDGVEKESGASGAERQPASSHFVEHDTEREKVGACVEFFGAYLFGRHVGDSAESGAGTGEAFGGGIAAYFVGGGSNVRGADGLSGKFGQAEIENFGVAAVGDKNVGRLDVAVNDAAGVSGVQSISNFDGQG